MVIRVYCPAKVNLFLAVGPRDARGYHPLRTIFQAVGLEDILDVTFGEPTRDPTLEMVGYDLPEENTITKALRLSREVFDLTPTHVRIEKNIPIMSGLGGGSSDAAGILRALNHIRPVPLQEIEAIAAAIGADVPFFLTGGRAKGEGYGDRITSMPDGLEEWFVIVVPEFGHSTVEMYARLDADPREWRDWPEGDILHNDFELVALHDICDILVERLLSLGAKDAAMSGSGSSVFGRFPTREAAERAGKQINGTHVVKSLTRAESLRIELNPPSTSTGAIRVVRIQ
ncbi:MAG: 4-(cytidine 5'-diphospho)-2-C-methyl-D-erythritol kinase [Fimbriimonadales bacterium]